MCFSKTYTVCIIIIFAYKFIEIVIKFFYTNLPTLGNITLRICTAFTVTSKDFIDVIIYVTLASLRKKKLLTLAPFHHGPLSAYSTNIIVLSKYYAQFYVIVEENSVWFKFSYCLDNNFL